MKQIKLFPGLADSIKNTTKGESPMAKNKKNNQQGGQVHQLPTRCKAESCNAKIARMNFCDEHFTWFKEGLITKEGQKPKDFDKKYNDYMNRHKKAS